jgi:hypothetical protein
MTLPKAKTRPLQKANNRWLLLMHQLPAKPAYLRVKVWRGLQAIGAIGMKNSMYVLPANEQSRGEFERLLRIIDRGGGDGAICEAEFISGVRDDQIQALFNAARDAEYDDLIKELRGFSKQRGKPKPDESNFASTLAKFRRRLADIERIDFFGTSSRVVAEALLAELEHRSITKIGRTKDQSVVDPAALTGRTWVTRQGIYVDRIACTWLIKRFIDHQASFKFVADKQYQPVPGELRFDMHDGEFTHEGDKCSFEVLRERARIKDPALKAIAEIIHDIDLKDEKFARPETAGISHVIAGICRTQASDEVRMTRGAELFEEVYEQFRRRDKG